MPRAPRNSVFLPPDSAFLADKPRKVVPHEFVLEALGAVSPWTRPMFGCTAIYVEDKIVLILRDKRKQSADNGVWLCTTAEHHASLRACDFILAGDPRIGKVPGTRRASASSLARKSNGRKHGKVSRSATKRRAKS